jgi:hypothetical protein
VNRPAGLRSRFTEADELEAARSDHTAKSMVELMRGLADDMESGALWDDGEPAASFDTTACMHCGRPAPTTVDEFTTWNLATNVATGEDVGVVCPDCRAKRP